MPKFNKRNVIKRLVQEPSTQKRMFWAREMKLLNSLMEIFPNQDFWQKVQVQKVPSLAVLKAANGITLLRKKYNEFNYVIPPRQDIILGEKTGEDKILSKKPKSIRQFIDE